MYRSSKVPMASDKAHTPASSSAFTIRQLNPSTYLIRETDQYGEYPHIYARIFTSPPLILISDTGCGTQTTRHKTKTNLSTFLSSQLNPTNSVPYAIILSHCHYDHILGIPHFLSSSSPSTKTVSIIASGHSRSFLSPENLPTHSLCRTLHIPTPQYPISLYADDNTSLRWPLKNSSLSAPTTTGPGADLNITTLHVPGHTPDSLAWYDVKERWLYVGDTFYERNSKDTLKAGEPPMPIIFPNEGNLVDYIASLKKLARFVREQNEDCETIRNHEEEDDWVTVEKSPKVKLSAAHVTVGVDAEEILDDVGEFCTRWLHYKIRGRDAGVERGEHVVFWEEEGEPRFSVRSPLRLVREARERLGIREGEEMDQENILWE